MEEQKIFSAKKWDIESLKQQDIPLAKGIYGYIDKSDHSLKYIGSAVGLQGLRGRIWAQHLNENYLENREEKFSNKDRAQIEKRIIKNGKIVIEKSAFRKNIARKHNLAPGNQCLDYLRKNFLLIFISLSDLNAERIHEMEKKIINHMSPEYNIRKF